MTRSQAGFTLIEVLVTVVIVGILSAVAIPAYSGHVTRSRTAEAFTALGAAQANAEQFWGNNRTYAGYDGASAFPAATPNFTYALSNATASTFTITATGRARMTGFTYTIDQNGTRATTATAGWGTNTACWVDKKGGQCSS
ncbi:prepilin-type N-terminal cleavage/methylation domain-containing protein [Massilia dura]|uniref:Prepilin-type N-terminal cleavage/methylation domain-containing protein n=1 Tax=Pseudoduganella dura TaxID=321982 RepID=A0A6I3XVF7_9BURK|nr:type IV pilin protein [Pseudoduganella dura]MUI15705.1 prepilin-type N-terminal cleavage/methylation domain-containing protein [Pseudoduganella dura]GGX81793.1 type IV minor pilin protein PilE [Pseudoduganella dura]